ncbi:lipid A export ATP-binding/permease protein MsbA [Clostridium puniceum]|uniref:Lipid A export ATP-binding/permease protein MsbA n=1 Tax=Clostridium puniceum TaxID=29367 RepID=A0A1S8TDN9_9CLOT|nr:ABC transporter ATP-binding protein [Clostridium puniceum]OOM75734.1 lipid A export ATP-binding/permease protein MsbA [Clostridium puniceum]
MIKILQKIYKFSGSMKKNLKRVVVFSVLNSIFDMLTFGALAIVFNGLINGVKSKDVWIILIIMILSIILKVLCSYASDFGKTKVSYFMCGEKRIHIGDRMKYMPMGYFNDNNLGSLTSDVTTTMGDIENNASMVLANILGGYIHVGVVITVMFFMDWRIGITILTGTFLFTLCIGMLQKKSEKVSSKRQNSQEKLVGDILEYIQGMLIVKSFNLGNQSNTRVKRAIKESKNNNLRMERAFVPYTMLQQIILYMVSIIVIIEAIIFYIDGSMLLPICLMMTVAAFMIFGQLQSAGSMSSLLRIIDVSIEKINAIDCTPVMDEKGKEQHPLDYNIKFENVSFSYGSHNILDNVSFIIPENTTTAIVGPSGAGKSTLCNLIARFWDVNNGKITIGGIDIKEYSLDSLLSNISEVFQNVYLFADTIENNIRFGKSDATQEEIVSAAKKSCCHEFIMELPDGYKTVIGEGGASLSGGEKQRISIARAILKDSPIIILDEATSSVDSENESELMTAVNELTKNKTVIMIAHRLKTVRNSDQILVINKGHIVQKGTHEELVSQPGIYANFVGVRKKAIGWKMA